ncbi:nectin-1-like isoform X2 [Hoplias malabaricus]|uniref:nectin-1-like isoform X2 n=1 Tax=Hoplias malabaricus TaxID=27720 RepID=UPI003462BDFD
MWCVLPVSAWVSSHSPKTHVAVRIIGSNSVVKEGEDASLFCQLVETNETLTRITWQKRTRETQTNRNFFTISAGGKTEYLNGLGNRVEFIGNLQEFVGTIRLKNVTLLDEGLYTCIINIFPSGPFEKAIALHVLVPPTVSVNTAVVPVAGQSEVTLVTCTAAKARPAAEVSWRLGALSDSLKVQTNQSVDPDGTYTVKSHLIGAPSKELNQQKVQCLVNHTSLNKEQILDYALIIHYPPQIVNILSVPSTPQEFRCVADANPPATKFIWSRVNNLSGQADDKLIEASDKLVIQLNSDNNGLYLCKASNLYGNGTGSLYFNVSGDSGTNTLIWSLSGIVLLLFLFLILYCKFCLPANCKLPPNPWNRNRNEGHNRVPNDPPQPTNNQESSETGI